METIKALFGPATWIAVVLVLMALVGNLERRLDAQDERHMEVLAEYHAEIGSLTMERDRLEFDLERQALSGVECLSSGWLGAGDFLHHLAGRLEAGGECNVVIHRR